MLLSLAEQQKYYDGRWLVDAYRPNRPDLERLNEILLCLHATRINFSKENLRFCDLGCGRGWIAHHLSSFGNVVGVDLSAAAVERAAKRWPEIEFIAAGITKVFQKSSHPLMLDSYQLTWNCIRHSGSTSDIYSPRKNNALGCSRLF